MSLQIAVKDTQICNMKIELDTEIFRTRAICIEQRTMRIYAGDPSEIMRLALCEH